jgi:CCR4-NOT transcription complex subunit 1
MDSSKYANLIKNAGARCTSSEDELNSIFGNDIGIINEEHVAHIVGMMAGDTESDNKWDHNFLYKYLFDKVSLDVVKIIKGLDYEGFMINDQQGLKVILDLYPNDKAKKEFPMEVLWGRWENYKGQFSILKQIVALKPDYMNFSNIYTNPIITMDNPSLINVSSAKSVVSSLVGQVWNSIDLMETLLNLLETDLKNNVLEMFQIASNQSPELLLLGLVQAQPLPWSKNGETSKLQKSMIMNLVGLFLNGHQSSSVVLMKLWQINPNDLIFGLLNVYNNDRSQLSRILDIAQEIKGLSQILETKYDFEFVIDLASLASRRDYLNLEKWLQERILEFGEHFVKACLDFLTNKITCQIEKNEKNVPPPCVLLATDVVLIFIKVLFKVIPPQYVDTFRNIILLAQRAYPKLASMNIIESLQMQQQYTNMTQEIENEAGSYFEKVYQGEISINQMVELMKAFKMSNNKRENEVFEYMIKSIFDEYQYLMNYPEKELIMTSALFGTLIQQKIISQDFLGTALKYILASLKQDINSNYYKFGVHALAQFKNRLSEWPKYCACLLQIIQLQQTNPEIIAYIKNLQSQELNSVDTKVDKIAIGNDNFDSEDSLVKEPITNIIFTSIKVDSLFDYNEGYEIPVENIKDKILFIVNNVSQSNLDSKAKEMKGLLKENYYRWFSKYLVVKRASIEPNFHSLYISLLDAIELPLLIKYVIHETYVNIYFLLNSNKCATSSSERTLLKNLGTWLGGITLAKNKPIKHKNLAFKELLLEGYDNNLLIVVIPFVCKTLEQVKYSTVFKPPNPWLMAIIRLLVEFYNFVDLKLNLKFEIEVLLKNLDVDITKVEPTSMLKDRKAKAINSLAEQQLVKEYEKMNLGKLPQSSSLESQLLIDSENLVFPALGQYLSFNQSSALFNNYPIARKIVQIAFDNTIDEIIKVFVDRSAIIVSIVTSELIKKDFSFEPNEEKMRKAAYMMAQNLVSNFVIVSCKEELRGGMYTFLTNYITKYKLNDIFSDQDKAIVVHDNIDLVFSIIEKAAVEKTLLCVDDNLANSYNTRRKHRERGQPYVDYNSYLQMNYPPSFPEALRLKQTGVTNQQFYVYEEFAKPSQEMIERNYRQLMESNLMKQEIPSNLKAQIVSQENVKESHQIQQCLEKINQILNELEKAIKESTEKSFSELTEKSKIRLLISQILPTVSKPNSSEEITFHLSQKIMQLLYKSESVLEREVYAVILESLCEFSKKVKGEVVAWLLYSEEERKYDIEVTYILLKIKLINHAELDMQLARLIENNKKEIVINYATDLIRKALFEEPKIAQYKDYINTIRVFSNISQRGNPSDKVKDLLKDVNLSIYTPIEEIDKNSYPIDQKFNLYFTEWIKLYKSQLTSEKSQAEYIIQLHEKSELRNENNSSLFFRICTEYCIALDPQTKSINVDAINAYARLIVLYIRYSIDPNDTSNKDIITRILSVIVLVLVNTHEKYQKEFNQTPFFRLFSSLLEDLHRYEKYLEPVNHQIFSAMSNTFHTLQPLHLPGFTFSWLELISHRLFMPKLLYAEKQKGWPYYQRLLIDLFKFFTPFLINSNEMKDSLSTLYTGTLNLFLVLLHDFPEFLSEHYYGLIDAIPSTCIQLRNLILCAYPSMRMPDPFDPSLKIETLPEINQAPVILSDYVAVLVANNFKQDLDNFLKTRKPLAFFFELNKKIVYSNQSDIIANGTKYNVPFINSLVLYVGIQDILFANQTKINDITTVPSPSKDIYQYLIGTVDAEGAYYFLSAFANQLRYPNSHTCYFINTLLNLFADAKNETIKEQITRVLLERIIVNRPHPWGLLYTLSKLTKEKKYGFWTDKSSSKYNGTENLYESVASVILDKAQYSNFLNK